MGRLAIEDMLNYVRKEQALIWHLQGNHYPPIPTSFVPACLQAIKACNELAPDRRIKLPDGVLYKDNRKTSPAYALVEFAHLEAFLEDEEDALEWSTTIEEIDSST